MMTGTTTRAAIAVTTLRDLLRGELDQTISLTIGEQPEDLNDEAIIIAPADPDTPGMLVRMGHDPALGNALVEEVEVAVVCRSYTGDAGPEAMDGRVGRCAAMVAACQRVVAARKANPPAWDKIEFGPEIRWHPVYTTAGANVYVGFSLVMTGLI